MESGWRAMIAKACPGGFAGWLVFAAALLWAAPGWTLSPDPGTPIVNQAIAQCSDANGNPLPAQSAIVSSPLSAGPLFSLEITPESNPVEEGASFTYTVKYENTGNAGASAVVLEDRLPPEVVFDSASDGGEYDASSGKVTWQIGSLAVGEGGFRVITVKVADTTATGSSIANEAFIFCAEGANATAVLEIKVGVGSNLQVSKSSSTSMVTPGGVIGYTITYRNIGNASSPQTSLFDQLPEGATYVDGSANPAASVQDNKLSWSIGDVGSGGQGTVAFQARVSPIASSGTIIANVASLLNPDQTVTSNTVYTAVSSESLLLLTAEGAQEVLAGQNTAYSVRVENISGNPLTGVVLIYNLPVGTTFVSADGGGAIASGGRVVSWNVGGLGAGQVFEAALVVNVDSSLQQGQLLENIVTASSNETPSQSAFVLTTVMARTPGALGFLDENGFLTVGYKIGENIFVRVKDLDRNNDPSTPDNVSVTLTSNEGAGARTVASTGAQLDSETLTLTETGPDTGVFIGQVASSTNATSPDDGVLTVKANCIVQAYYEDPLDQEPVHVTFAMIDPSGVVFDAVNGTPVANVVVTLRNWDNEQGMCDYESWPTLPEGEANPAAPTGPDGRFLFPLAGPGDYCFEVVTPSGYLFPSAVPDESLPPGYNIVSGARGEKFTLSTDVQPLVSDVPLDPPVGRLTISKTANKTRAAIGDLVIYTLKVSNKGVASVTGITLSDRMPHGVEIVPGSSLLGDEDLSDPVSGSGRELVFALPDLGAGEELELSYRAAVCPDALKGNGVNTASASGTSLGLTVSSNSASCKLKITGGIFTDKGTVIGRVFRYGGEEVNRQSDGEIKGIPGVVLYLEDGTRVTTDENGKFSIPGVEPGTHVIRLDETTLLKNLLPVPVSVRFLGDGLSQVITMQLGELSQADFVLKPSGVEEGESASVGKVSPAQKNAAEDSGEAGSGGDSPGAGIEEEIKGMTGEPEFLNLSEGSLVRHPRLRVILKGPYGTEVNLFVNGSLVDPKQVGRKIDYEMGNVSVTEYVDVHLDPGNNDLLAEFKDQFGIVRGSRGIKVVTPGAPAKISVTPDRADAPADGDSLVNVKVELRDKEDLPVSRDGFVTAAVSAGDFAGKDNDPSTEGFQVALRGGVGAFSVRAPRETGEAVVSVEAEGLKESVKLYFTPHLRSMLLAGYGEVVFGKGRGTGDMSYLEDSSPFEEGYYHGGRGAFFLKGEVYEGYLLTASYDSGKEKREDLFRENDTTLDTEDKYPIYGDESKLSYEAMSTGKLYLKVEKNRSSVLYGDFRTGLDENDLLAYTRSFNGLKYELNAESLKIEAFESYTDQTQVVDALQGKGISGNYYLSMRPVVEGSESVVIEVRDRYRPGTVLKREGKSRGSDYEIDYYTGALLFKEPVPSHDGSYNPVYIIVSYESRGSEKYYVYGGRAGVYPFDWLEVGATWVTEEKEIGDYRIAGADLTLKLPGKTSLKAEYAETKGIFEEEDLFEWHKGSGWSIDARSEPFEGLRLGGHYRTAGEYFQNLSATDVARGTTKYGAEGSYDLGGGTKFTSSFFEERDDLNEINHKLAVVGAETAIGKTRISAEVSDESSSESYQPLSTPRSPLDVGSDLPHDLTAGKLGFETEITKDLSFTASHKNNLTGENFQSSQAGLNYRINGENRLYLREEYQRFEDTRETRTLLGAETQVVKNTVAFTEYRLADGADGERNQSLIGLRNKFHLSDSVTGNVTGEYLKTLSGSQREEEPDAVAGTLGIEYLQDEYLKITGRAERRMELSGGGLDSWLGETGLAAKLSPDLSLLLRERYSYEELETGEHVTSRAMTGLAFRPLTFTSFNALAKVEFKYERNSISTPAYKENAWIFSGQGIWKATRSLSLTGKYAGKLARDEKATSYTDLISGGFLYDLTERWDFGAEYRILYSREVDSKRQGGSAEIGYRVVKNLWAAAGYSFDKFDSDLEGESYQGEGPYVKLRLKFDEKTLGH